MIEIKVGNWHDRDDFINWILFKHPEFDVSERNSNYDEVNGHEVCESSAGGHFALSLMQDLYEEYESDMGDKVTFNDPFQFSLI